mmetsp:Transcript_136212/g.247734  ORF Transcript_136212/g.247734 Transcript_136212/m.247734 type:complete len:655 (-) Transcript_136212:21-1985(-)
MTAGLLLPGCKVAAAAPMDGILKPSASIIGAAATAGASSNGGSNEGDECRRRLLDALSGGLSDEAFSWRRKVPSTEEALSNASLRQENTVEEMKRRMASMYASRVAENQSSDTTAPAAAAVAPQPQELPVRPSTPTALAAAAGAAASAEVAAAVEQCLSRPTTPADEKRQQFLSRLAQGLREVELPRKKEHPPVDDEASSDNAHMACPQARPESPAEAMHSVLGPDFFAEVKGLQERIAQRKLSTKMPASTVLPGSAYPAAGLAAAAPQVEATPEPANSAAARESFCAGSGYDPAPLLSPRSGSGEDGVLPQSERRRPKPGHGADSEVVSSESADDEVLRSSSDELLRWAEEVLRKANSATQDEYDVRKEAGERTLDPPGSWSELPPRMSRASAPTAGSSAPGAQRAPRPAGEGSRTRGGSARPPLTPSAKERRRRAEELKDEVRRLQEESEHECRRLEEEGARREQFASDESWRRRVNYAAEEMRSNFSNWSFDSPRRDSQQRGSSVPPPKRPSPPPGAAPSGSRSFRRAAYGRGPQSVAATAAAAAEFAAHEALWAQLEAQLDSTSGPIHFADIPWPVGSGSITGVLPGDTVPGAKRKLANALRRWHPDKWRRILNRVPESEQAPVMERVKSIAQGLLEEKARLTGPGGLLH